NAPSADKVATHFWLQVGSSGLLTLLCAALVPVWRHAYPDRALLAPVIVALAVGQLAASLGATPLLMLRKELGFGRVARIDLVKAFVKTAVVLSLAHAGGGVWALVAEQLLEALVLTIAIWRAHPLPVRWVWDRDIIRRYLSYGLPMFGAELAGFVLMRFDDFWVGTVLGNAPLGFYAVAYSLAEYPRRVASDPIQHVVLATLARVQEDRLRLSQVAFRASAYLVRVGAFAAAVFALVAPEFVAVLIGEQWLPAVPAFQLLVLFAMSLPLVAVALNVLVATGESRRVLQVRLVQVAVFVPSVVLGAWRWGIVGAALAEDLMVLVGLAVLLRMVRRHVDLSVARLLGAPLVAIAVAAGAVALLRDLLAQAPPVLRMVGKAGAAGLVYAGALALLERRDLRRVLGWGWRALRRAQPPAGTGPERGTRQDAVSVLFVDHAEALGGAEHSLLLLLAHLDRARFRPVLACNPGRLAEEARALDVQVAEVAMPRLQRELRGPVRLARGVRDLVRVLQNERIEVVYCNTVRSSVYAALAAQIAGRPLLWQVHDILRPSVYLGWMARRAERVVAVSEAAAAPLRSALPSQLPVVVIPNSVELAPCARRGEGRERVRQLWGVSADAPVIGLVGRLEPWKGQADFVRSMAIVSAHWPAARFVIVGGAIFGEREAYRRELEQLVDELGLNETLVLAGHQDDVAGVYAALDLLVHCSAEPEPFGRVLIEGMAAELPAVAYAAGGVVEIVVHGETGLLVPFRDTRALAEAVLTLLRSPEVARRMGAAGRQRVERMHDARALTRQAEDV
ncbi:MAG: oligosaccharide flippase family protein, partial [Chloroflexi bacterium]|nr:oligosaccharide flippase family protein [Chloroflexota bacterium]